MNWKESLPRTSELASQIMRMWLVLVIVFSSCGRVQTDTVRLKNQDQEQPKTVNAPFNRTTSLSTVIRINRLVYPDYNIKMHIRDIVDQTGLVAFIHKGDTVTCRPNFVKDSNGNILFDSEINKGLINVNGLSTGDVVKAVIYYNGDERGREWWLMSCSKKTE